ncbi:MAG TPA: pyridoxine 5'-phosphate synthase [Paludibacteraceae bacterium]|mgnify:CR=1 FL=1|nr:pyridoxine 5'-phosphate synthase [Paludibacteraceae bacterium]HQF50690.1 pyridoxine 5'-phosphate synthase [Paludibacteraceae bacterium]
MTKLSVNINKVATIRNARGGNVPDLLKVAVDCQSFGAEGITVHPRPDERHVRYKDVIDLSPLVTTEFNIEGYPSPSFVELVKNVKPTQVTLVPDAPDAITSSAGWDTIKYDAFLRELIEDFQSAGIRVSIFIDTNIDNILNAAKTGADRIELYTEPYAEAFTADKEAAIRPFVEAAKAAKAAGLGVNAGHDLNLDNLKFFHDNIPWLKEVSIGHALISDALYYGLEKTIRLYKECLE